MMGTRYVGAGVLASAVGMDKHFMKLVLSASGLPVGPFVSITPAEWARDPAACLEAVAALSYPLFVKPARGGSSLGISRVDTESELAAAIELAQRHDPKIIVEQGFVGARELECGVLAGLDGAAPRASEVAEIRVARDGGFYDFEAKYLPDEQVGLDVPADIDARDRRRRAPPGGADVRGHRLRRPGPGGHVLDRRRAADGQRDQHDAGVHPALHVPADVGRQRRALPGAGRAPDPPGRGTTAWVFASSAAAVSPRGSGIARRRVQEETAEHAFRSAVPTNESDQSAMSERPDQTRCGRRGRSRSG